MKAIILSQEQNSHDLKGAIEEKMLYDLIQTKRGKKSIMMTDSLTKVNARMKTLRQSQRRGVKGEKVIYTVVPTDSNVKFRRKPHDESWRAG